MYIFDDFESGAISGWWNRNGTNSIGGSAGSYYLVLNPGDTTRSAISSPFPLTLGQSSVVEFQAKSTSSGAGTYCQINVGFMSDVVWGTSAVYYGVANGIVVHLNKSNTGTAKTNISTYTSSSQTAISTVGTNFWTDDTSWHTFKIILTKTGATSYNIQVFYDGVSKMNVNFSYTSPNANCNKFVLYSGGGSGWYASNINDFSFGNDNDCSIIMQ